MNAKLGYLLNGRFYLLYSSSLLGVDAYTQKKYKNKADLIKKENLPKESIIVLYCQDKEGRVLYNRGGYPLQSTVIYKDSELKDVKDMMEIIKGKRKYFFHITEDLNIRFNELKGIHFPGSISKMVAILNKNENAFVKYYYAIKQASILYFKEEKRLQNKYKKEEPVQKDHLAICIKDGKLTVYGENIREYLRECQNQCDDEEFWNLVSLDDLEVTIVSEKTKKSKRQVKRINRNI